MDLIFIIFASVILFFLYMKWTRQYWKRKNVPHIDTNAIWGNIESPLTGKRGFGMVIKELYEEFKRRRHRHAGIYIFNQSVYLPVDPEIVRHVLAKDFPHFLGQGFGINVEQEPLSGHLLSLRGEEWKNMRAQLTPTFTSGKMKMMFNTLLECGVPMIQHVDKLSEAGKPLDIKEILGCYTTDVVGSCAFGLDCNSFKDPDAEFRTHGRGVVGLRFTLYQFYNFFFPSLAKRFYIRMTKRKTETFFINVIKNILDYRQTNNFKRNDFIQLFIEMNEKAKENGTNGITLHEIAAQSFVFFVAGFETSSTTMTFTLHELAFNQDIQDKLREEIRDTMKKDDGKLTYDGIMGMKYMDKVINETLRKYPPGTVLNRLCNKNFQVPNTDVIVEEGIRVCISILGIHRDEEYYPNPEKFDPERFSEENKAKRPPFTFLPFGEGPRMCIGLRFGVMQAKTGIAMLLTNYRISPAQGETYKFDFDPTSPVLSKKGSIMLVAEKIAR